MPIERDSLVARLLAYGTQWNDGKTNGTLFKFSDGSRFFLAEEDAAALSRPEQVVTDEMVSAAYEELRRRLTLHPSRDQVKAALETACLTTAAPPTNLQQLLEAYDFNGQEWAPKAAAPLQADASAPASPAIGVQAVTEAAQFLLGRLRHFSNAPGNSESDDRWHFSVLPAMRMLDAALHPAPEAASAASCQHCNGTGSVVEYIHEERGVSVTGCPACVGTGEAPSPKGVSDGVRAAVKPLTSAIQHIVDENEYFRVGMPGDWAGDPLQDAIEDAHKIAIATLAALSQEPVPSTAPLHGPFGWLNGCRGLSEDSWTLESEPLENSDEYFAIPLYALTDPFKEIRTAVPSTAEERAASKEGA